MREHTPSRTAAWVAGARGLGRHLPDQVRLVDDPYGFAFSDDLPSMKLVTALDRARVPLLHLPLVLPWVLYMQVRTRVIDDAVAEFVHRGGRQLVILGAGYDCRALRLTLAGGNVFEIDHPATQGHKRATLDRIGAQSPARYLPWDFEGRPLAELPGALAGAGLDAAQPTFTIWEGVTMYLTEPAIDASLRAIRAWSAPGSRLAMTYFAKSRIDAPSLATRAIQQIVARVGEPWRWGWVPSQLPGFMLDRGWTVERDVAMSDAAKQLLPPELARHVQDPDRRIALAAAPESIAVAR
jgi:methyltransferase (TIGR00027 family)